MKKFFLSMLAAFTAVFFVSSEAVALPTCSGSPITQWWMEGKKAPRKGLTKNWHNCFGKVVDGTIFALGNGSWEGEWINGKLNGNCTITILSETYLGECKNGLKHGNGKYSKLVTLIF